MGDLILNQAKVLDHLGGVWLMILLVFIRIFAFAATAPLLGNKQIPALVKIGFSIIITLIIFPLLDTVQEYPRGYKFIYLLLLNSLIGMLIGWVASLVLEIGRIGGEMLDMQMGLNAATIFDPASQSQSTIIGHFFSMLSLTLFVSLGGMEKLIEALYKSFDTFPIIIYQLNFNVEKLIRATGDILSIGFLIVSPIIMIVLALDLILGLMSRAAPQINAFQVSFTIKPTVGIVLILVLLPTMIEIFARLFSNPLKYLY